MKTSESEPTVYSIYQPFVAAAASLLARTYQEKHDTDDPELPDDIAQAMWLGLLIARDKKPDATESYLRDAAMKAGCRFLDREYRDGPFDGSGRRMADRLESR